MRIVTPLGPPRAQYSCQKSAQISPLTLLQVDRTEAKKGGKGGSSRRRREAQDKQKKRAEQDGKRNEQKTKANQRAEQDTKVRQKQQEQRTKHIEMKHKQAEVDETKADHKETALSDCCHHKWGKSSLLVRCLANPKRFHCAKKDRTAYLGKGHGKDLLKKILDRIDRMDTRLNHVHNVVRSIHAKHGSGKSGVLDEESGITLSEH